MLNKERTIKNTGSFGDVFGCGSCGGEFLVGDETLLARRGRKVNYCPFCGLGANKEVKGEDNSIAGRIRRFIEKLLEDKPKFHGSVQANFSIGGLTNVNVMQSFKGKDVG